jgi:hypothetical protein
MSLQLKVSLFRAEKEVEELWDKVSFERRLAMPDLLPALKGEAFCCKFRKVLSWV